MKDSLVCPESSWWWVHPGLGFGLELRLELGLGIGLGLGLGLRLRLGLGLSAALGFSGLQREVVRLEGDVACALLRHRAAPQRTVAVAHVHLERIAQLARHTPG